MLLLLVGFCVLTIVYFQSIIDTALVTFALPVAWLSPTSNFIISQERDNFDVTFSNYSADQQSSLPEYPDLIPPVLHQIVLGSAGPKEEWLNARNHCMQYHAGWQFHLWTDENAAAFVAEKFPHLKEMWEGYRYPIQKVDALRYMVLYEYGGVVLDMDLDCRHSLGPLRRFGFVAPAAHPSGFSNGMMMASRWHPFVGELVNNLPRFNLNWFGLPYPTVMFSTGCHYASVVHTLQKTRSDLRILAGPKELPNLHRLNGNVITPLFHHLGSSSWHSFDASLIVSMFEKSITAVLLLQMLIFCIVLRALD
ncbi:glycosyltransferase family 32 protein [Oidiodendron maius Zn]|uniref:Glycosyltransferase family 32 protein n=1 Tax=Oidiodendron maius (strain Zn) TaxID=913774 RepID=A0A0C3DN07_OIDMZ|nr:glycosyltransferase family 32 protein [Oidiodendron maius Zn]